MRAILLAAALAAGASDPVRLIDGRIEERWRSEGVRAADPAGDYEFLRRLSLDLRGVIPEPGEARAFAANPDRAAVIDAWLRSEEFAQHWARLWVEELTVNRALKPKIAGLYEGLEDWIREAVRANMAFDRFARRLLTAKGPTDLDPAAGFLAAAYFNNSEGPKDVVDRAARVFLGVQVRCAECHDHPFDDWTQQDFYGLVAFFHQSAAEGKRSGAPAAMMMRSNDAPSWWIADDVSKGDLGLPGAKTKEAVRPAYKPTAGSPAAGEARRAAFARLLTSDPQFARAAVNRHWGMLVGRGFVHPLDGFTAARKPSHPDLLDELAQDFARSGYDVRRLLRAILLSRAYQASSKGAAPDRSFARARTAPLSADQLWESLVRATGQAAAPEGKSKNPKEAFLREFGGGPSVVNDPAPTEAEATISQALYFMNGEFVSRRAPRLTGILEREPDPGRRLDEIFLATLSRPPEPRERDLFDKHLRKHGGTVAAYEDIFWALINSTEFSTRH